MSEDCAVGDIDCVNPAVNIVKTTVATVSLIVITIFIIYVVVYTCITVRWDILFRNYAGDGLAARIQKFFEFKRYNNRVVFINNPIIRLLFFLQLSCGIELTQFYLETFRWNKNDYLCVVQSLMITFFGISKACWSLCIATWLFYVIVLKRKKFLVVEFLMHIFSWSASLIVTLITVFTNTIGDAGGYCWIKSETTRDNVVRFVAYYIPIWLSIIAVASLYTTSLLYVLITQWRIARRLNKRTRTQIFQNSIKSYIILFSMPLIFLLGWVFPTYLSIHAWIFGVRPTALQILHSLSSPTQGFYNAIAYASAVFFSKEKVRHIVCVCGERARCIKKLRKEKDVKLEETATGQGREKETEEAKEMEFPSTTITMEEASNKAAGKDSEEDYYDDGEYRPGRSLFDLEQEQAKRQAKFVEENRKAQRQHTQTKSYPEDQP